MKFFTRQESIIIGLIFVIIVGVSIPNFSASLARARDAQRKNDLGNLKNGLATFQNDLGSYPLSSPDGRIRACDPVEVQTSNKKTVIEYQACDWGKDALADELEPAFPAYIKVLPQDPKWEEGASFLYISNGSRFQVYAHLELESDDEFDPKVVARGLLCGDKICNFGKASGDTPLEKSIEEYENELIEERTSKVK
jgi:type II secretory pathway pseudopilin PulG